MIKPYFLKPCFLVLSCCTLSLHLIGSPMSASGLFKHQDAQGRWHFTDKPASKNASQVKLSSDRPKAQTASAATTAVELTKSPQTLNELSDDLAAYLAGDIKPKNAIETASMAVVAIKTLLGGGSGFFISNQGHIITNRHVVRSEKATASDLKKYQKTDKNFTKWADNISKRLRQIKKAEQELLNYAQSWNLDPKTTDDEDYLDRQQAINSAKKDFLADKASYTGEKKTFDKAYSDFQWTISRAAVARSFDIILKNGRVLKADLVHISQDEDLAVLKLDGYRTPYLPLGNLTSMGQGDPVYAIGSPLGQQDSVSKGILTSRTSKLVITDTQILPGNSGGPLINETGEVIAINTARLSQVKGGAGFGHSIPIPVAIKILKSHYQHKEWPKPVVVDNAIEPNNQPLVLPASDV